ncbi:hypothetical protein Pla52n_47900 [Stieleria varia]|uniref:Uncharacterized protein n=1 Tax=Stieleria varia TaxID=2528005 RepID=A0A5C6AFR3_9BACT|nr:hypothetical protein Pla52n_47900 [Stieleria varia]
MDSFEAEEELGTIGTKFTFQTALSIHYQSPVPNFFN